MPRAQSVFWIDPLMVFRGRWNQSPAQQVIAKYKIDGVCFDHKEDSGRCISRGMYQASGKRLINADINGSLNIGRKVFPTAFDGLGIGAALAVRPRRPAF